MVRTPEENYAGIHHWQCWQVRQRRLCMLSRPWQHLKALWEAFAQGCPSCRSSRGQPQPFLSHPMPPHKGSEKRRNKYHSKASDERFAREGQGRSGREYEKQSWPASYLDGPCGRAKRRWALYWTDRRTSSTISRSSAAGMRLSQRPLLSLLSSSRAQGRRRLSRLG